MFRVLVLFYLICVCLNANTQSFDSITSKPFARAITEERWITYPQDGSITVTGIAGRRRNQDEALVEVLADAARKSLKPGITAKAR
jgi:hypothetical protein